MGTVREGVRRFVDRLPNPGRSSSRAVRAAWKAVILVVGATVIVAGVAMLVLPGPGIVVIILGLAILASEFVWARALLDRAKAQAERARVKGAAKLERRRERRAAKAGGRA